MMKTLKVTLAALLVLFITGVVVFAVTQNLSIENALKNEGVTHTVEVLDKGTFMKRAGKVYTVTNTATVSVDDQLYVVTLPEDNTPKIGETITICLAGEIVKVDYADCAA